MHTHFMSVKSNLDSPRKYPFNIRSFFTPTEKKDIGLGIELWRGYFQCVLYVI